MPRLHHINRPLEERTVESQDSTIWVSDAGAILMGGGMLPQTSQAHMDPRIQPVAPSVCSCFGSRCDEFHGDSANPQGSSHPNTTRAGCYETTTSAPSSTASVKRLCLSSSSSTSLCLIHSFIALFLSFSDAHPYFHFTALSLSLILSCVSVLCSACAQRMSNMC